MVLRKLSPLALAATLMFTPAFATAQQGNVQHVTFDEDVVALEFIGNVNNSGTNSNQFGYFNFVTQIPAFNDTPETAATANFTFYTAAVTQRVTDERKPCAL